ncbi:MAG: hypothetical protein ACFE0P_02290 [Oceanicaulis sp.]
METAFWGSDFWGEVLADPAIATWLRIIGWGFAFLWLWLIANLLRGGFNDLTEITASPYATARERWNASVQMPVRFVAIIAAAGVGAAGFAIGIFFQGAVAIFLWRQAFG